MTSLSIHSNWQERQKLSHWVKHSLVPTALIVCFLCLPKPWSLAIFQTNNVIEIELLKNAQITPEISPIKDPPIPQPPKETIFEEPAIKKPIETPTEPTPKTNEKAAQAIPQPKQVPKTTPKSQQPVTSTPNTTPNTTPEINAGDVLLMMKNRKSIEVPKEFQARTGPAKDFYIPEQEIHDWLADIPYLDESVDKPKLQMRFYAEGIEGSVEKFFDKITISKTFTTKYGTKIHCALIGVIAACSWK